MAALKTQICEKYFGLWSTRLPRSGTLAKSPCYGLEGGEWYFKLTSDMYKNTEIWKIYFMKQTSSEVSENFLLTVYVRGKTKDFFMDHKLITGLVTEIWSFNHTNFASRFPHIDIYKELTFVFHVDCSLRDKEFQIAKTDDFRCLENLSLDFGKLLDGSWYPDVQLKCGDCTIPAHKLVLGSRSEVFRTMLHTDMREGRQGAVEIVDMEPETLRAFVRYLYTGSLPELGEDLAVALFVAGDKYQVRALMARCSSFLAGNLTREKACEILVLADAHGDEDLKDSAISFILDKDIPEDEEVWSVFCDSCPKLAIQVLRRAYKRPV